MLNRSPYAKPETYVDPRESKHPFFQDLFYRLVNDSSQEEDVMKDGRQAIDRGQGLAVQINEFLTERYPLLTLAEPGGTTNTRPSIYEESCRSGGMLSAIDRVGLNNLTMRFAETVTSGRQCLRESALLIGTSTVWTTLGGHPKTGHLWPLKTAISNNARTQVFTPLLADEASAI
jgi:hypothetical protein